MKTIWSLTCAILLTGTFSLASSSSAADKKAIPEPVACDKYVILIGDHNSDEGKALIDEDLLQCYQQRLEDQGKSVRLVTISELMRNPIEDNPETKYCYLLFSHGLGKSKPYQIKTDGSYINIEELLRGLPGTPAALNLFTCQSGEAINCDALSCTALFCATPSWEDLMVSDLNDWLKAVCDGKIKASGDPAEIFKNWRPERSGLLPFGGYQYPTGERGGRPDSIRDDFLDEQPAPRPVAPPSVAPPAVAPPTVVIPK